LGRAELVRLLRKLLLLSPPALLAVLLISVIAGAQIGPRPRSAGPAQANIWMDTSGGSCTRYSAPASYSDGQACASLDAAYNVAQTGDTIVVKGGTYGGQTVPARSLGTTPVTIAEANGEAASFTGHVQINASNLVVDGFAYACGLGCTSVELGRGVNVVLKSFDSFALKASGSYQTISDGDIGPFNGCSGSAEDLITLPNPDYTVMHHITIRNNLIHDLDTGTCGAHTDCIQSFNFSHLTIENNIFSNCPTLLIAYAFNSTYEQQSGATDTLIIRNNLAVNFGYQGHGFSAGNPNTVRCGSNNLNNVIENNTFVGSKGLTVDISCGGSPDGVVRNNVGIGYCQSIGGNTDLQYRYNVQSQSVSGCDATNRTCNVSWADPNHNNFNYDLAPTDSCARNVVPSAQPFPTIDREGTPRPQEAAADAGAVEVCSSGSCFSTSPPPPPTSPLPPPPPPPAPTPPPPPPPAGTEVKFGEQRVLPEFDSGNGNLLISQYAVLSTQATLQSISFYVATAAGQLRLGVYDSNGPSGGPGTLLANTADFTAIAGWNTKPTLQNPILPPGTYWLAYLPSSSSLAFQKAQDGSSTGRYYALTYSPLPSPFSATTSTTPSHWSLYATAIVGTATPPPPPALPPPPPAPPIAPSAVGARLRCATSTTKRTFPLGWNRVSGATSYKLYVDAEQVSTAGGTADRAVFTIACGVHTYGVRASNSGGDSPIATAIIRGY
jgi:hypothetical protein